MEQQEIFKLLDVVKYVPSDKRDEVTNAILMAAAESLSFEKIKSLTDGTQETKKSIDTSSTLEFSETEVLKMPKTFRKEFRVQGCTAHVRKRESGKGTWNYEIRYRRNGYNIAVSANNLEKAKKKFIDKLNSIEQCAIKPQVPVQAVPKVVEVQEPLTPTTFHEFAMYYFDNFWKRTVTELTYKNEMYRYRNYLKPYFESTEISKIRPVQCQQLMDSIADKGFSKTADEIYSTMSKIFKAAIKHGIIVQNPLDLVVHQKHERKHGKALTKAEEKALLDAMEGTRYKILFAVALYTGLRPNEYKTARIEGDFIVARNSKRKRGKEETKKIPITPMLKPYLEGVTEFNFPYIGYMRDQMNAVLPNHILYDLRTTFYTRCAECGLSEYATKKFAGHSLGGLADTYTDLSDEFLLKEGAKLNY